MKAQFKYAFLSGLYVRGIAFAVVFIINTLFIIFGSMGKLPLGGQIAAVSLGGIAVAVMFAANIGGDIAIARRMFSAPDAYLYALTPIPRWKMLLTSILTMGAMDILSMAIVIGQQTIIALNLAGEEVWKIVREGFQMYKAEFFQWLWIVPLAIAAYLLVVMIIIFCVTAKKSFLYKLPASGFLTFLLVLGCLYAVSLLQLLLVPFGIVQTLGTMIIVTLSGNMALPLYTILLALEAAGLFVLTSKLMERKMNI